MLRRFSETSKMKKLSKVINYKQKLTKASFKEFIAELDHVILYKILKD